MAEILRIEAADHRSAPAERACYRLGNYQLLVAPIVVSIEVGAKMIDMAPSVFRAHIDAGRCPTVRFPSTKRDGEPSRRVQVLVDDLRAFARRYRVEVER